LKSDQTKLKELQTEAGKNPITDKGKIGKTWKDEITQKLADINAVLTGNPIPNNKEANEAKIKKDVFADTPDEIGKKIITAAVTAKILETELPDLKTLVEALQKANKADFKADQVTKNAIQPYATATDANDDGKKKKRLWDIVNDASVKEKATDTKTWALKGWEAAEKYKDIPNQNNPLQTAQDTLKTALGGDNDNWKAVNKKLKDNKEVAVWEKAKQIYEIAKKVHDGVDNNNEGSKLADLQKNNKPAWDAINEIKVGGKGYADEALTKHKAKEQALKEVYTEVKKLAKAGDDAKARAEAEKAKQSSIYTSGDDRVKTRIDNMIVRAPLAAKLYKLGTEDSKLLGKLLIKDVVKYDSKDGKTQHDKTHLEKLNEMEEQLKAFQSATSGEKHKAFTHDAGIAPVVTALLKEIKNQKEIIEKDNSNNKNTNGDKPFLKTPLGYLTIVLVVLVIVGAIAYFIKTNSSEEGEGE